MSEVFYPAGPTPDPPGLTPAPPAAATFTPEPPPPRWEPDQPPVDGSGAGQAYPSPTMVPQQRQPFVRIGGTGSFRPQNGLRGFSFQPTSPRVGFGLGVAFILVALLIGLGSHQATARHRAYSGGVSTTGTVESVSTSVTTSRNGADSTTYYATIDFAGPGGAPEVFTDQSLHGVPTVHGQVRVSYPSGDPARARWVQPGSTVKGLLGIALFLGLALVAIRSAVRLRRSQRSPA